MRVLRICIVCSKEFYYRNAPSDPPNGGRYCSKKCQDNNMSNVLREKGIKPIVHYEGSFEKANGWLGDKASYSAKHRRIYRRFGKPQECEHCGTTKAKRFEWANKSGEYRTERSDWLRLCTSCHRKYDNHSQKAWITRKARMVQIII